MLCCLVLSCVVLSCGTTCEEWTSSNIVCVQLLIAKRCVTVRVRARVGIRDEGEGQQMYEDANLQWIGDRERERDKDKGKVKV